MPTKGYSIRIENYNHLEDKSCEAGCSQSEYLNILIERDRADNGTAKKEIRHEKATEARVEARTIIKKAKVAPKELDTKKIRVNTCKYEGCGALLPYFGAKVCKACKGKQ